MNSELFDALELLEKEKGISQDYMLERVSQALLAAYKRDNAGEVDNVFVEPDCEKKEIRMYVKKTVVEAVENPAEEIKFGSIIIFIVVLITLLTIIFTY